MNAKMFTTYRLKLRFGSQRCNMQECGVDEGGVAGTAATTLLTAEAEYYSVFAPKYLLGI